MQKLLISMLLALPLMACGTGDESTGPMDTEMSSSLDAPGIVIDDLSAEPDTTSLPVEASTASDVNDLVSCKVTLQWCRHPDHGNAVCTGVGPDCTKTYVRKVCERLVAQYC